MKEQKLDPFLAISDPSRRQILVLLSKDTMTINALAQNFAMSRPAVSKHIKVLEEAGFLTIQDIGRERHCLLNQEGFRDLQEWIDYFDAFWQEKLQNLNALLNKRKEG